VNRSWNTAEPGRLIGRGHPAGDFLEAWGWNVLDEADGYVKVSAHLPDHVRTPRGQLFGGFTPAYADLIALFTVRSRAKRAVLTHPGWLATVAMKIDYFEPILGPRFILESRREKQRGRTHFVQTRFLQDGELAVLATTTMREVAADRSLGDG